MKVGIDIGSGPNGTPAMLDLEELLATRLLVQGNSGSGKSHLLRRLLEQSAPWVQQVRHRPRGRLRHAGRQVRPCRGRRRAHRSRARPASPRASASTASRSCSISKASTSSSRCAAPPPSSAACSMPTRDYWYPVLVVVDEAQLFAPAAAGEVADEARRLSLGGHDQPDVPRPQARPGRRHRHPAPGQARQERRGRGLQLPDGPHLPRHRHGARRRPARHGAARRPKCSAISARGHFVALGPAHRRAGRCRSPSARSRPPRAPPAPS